MLAKNDVLSEFKNVRSFERVDLLCSLLDLCLPYELRFLGTCLEFLGKRDFIELREDERHANNVNHLSQFRCLMDENTRRKLVLYVSLLNSCNSDCASCLNDTLTALCISDVSQVCRAEPETAEKLLDELLLLYTIAVKHPAFSLHQKTEFAAHLSRLQEEDNRLSHILYSNEDATTTTQRISKPADCIPETPCAKDSPSNNIEDRDSSSQISVNSLPNQLTCHVLSGGSVYTSAVLPSTLHQASATCLKSSETGHSVIAVGLTASPVSSELMIGPGPGPGPGMVLPLTSTSHCVMPATGDIQKGSMGHPSILAPIMCVPPESVPMPYPGHAQYSMMVPLVSHLPGPPLGCPAASMAPTLTSPSAPMTLSNMKPALSPVLPVPSPCSMSSKPASSCSLQSATTVSIASKENCNKSEQGEAQSSQPVSPANTPPPGPKSQVSNVKSSGHLPQNPLQILQQPHLTTPNQPQLPPSSQQPYHLTHMFPAGQHYLTSPKPNSTVVHQVQYYPNQIMSVGSYGQHPQSSPHVPSKYPGQWCPPEENLKEVIVREMPNYKANLQDYSPDELLDMGDDQLKDIGLSTSAIQQLRSIISKLHSSTNGVGSLNRSDAAYLNESSRRRHYHPSDNKAVSSMQGPLPGTVNYGYVVPSSYPNSINNSASNGSSFNKGSKRHLQITNQVRALQLEDDSRRPCSNSSSTSDCSSGSHSPPETPSLPLISEVPCDHHLDRGYSGKDSGAESWNSDDRLHEGERVIDDRSRGSGYQPPGMQRNLVNSRSRGLSKAPPGIPTIPRGRGHPMADKNRRDPVSSMNGVPSEMNNQPPPYAMSGATGLPSNVPYPAPPVSSFLPPTPFTTMHAFHRFQSGSFLPTGTAYPFPPNGEMWSPFHQPSHPQATHPYITAPIVAFSPAHPPPKLSCYNCGRQGHQGSDCKESTFEEITQQGQYHLDYKPFKEPGDCRDADK